MVTRKYAHCSGSMRTVTRTVRTAIESMPIVTGSKRTAKGRMRTAKRRMRTANGSVPTADVLVGLGFFDCIKVRLACVRWKLV